MLKEGRTPKHYYRPIGDVFGYEDKDGNKVTLEVVKCRLCEGCYFDHRETECVNSEEVTGSCVMDVRWDETSVIFKEVENENENENENERRIK